MKPSLFTSTRAATPPNASLTDKEAVTVFKRFKRVSHHGGDLSGVIDKFIAGLSHFSKLKVLTRMAYFDNKRANDMRANVKKKAITADVLKSERL